VYKEIWFTEKHSASISHPHINRSNEGWTSRGYHKLVFFIYGKT